VRPAIVVILETEIWPNFLRESRRAGVPVAFVNGRISERSYGRASRALRFGGGILGGFLRGVLNDGALYMMQSAADAERLVSLGASGARVVVAGNLKYDLARPSRSPLVAWLEDEVARSGRGPVLVAGSVTAGEEAAVLEAYAAVCRKWPAALLILAPRKPERFGAAEALVGESGHRAVRRSSLCLDGATGGSIGALADTSEAPRSVLLLDTIGELAGVYQVADAAFVGGSLEPVGGHNPLEPAAVGKVPLFGTSMENFREIAGNLLRAEAAIQVGSGAELGAAWLALLDDPARRRRMGEAALELVKSHRGATAAGVERIAELLMAREAEQ
jgi:3-deoxy-D-manno-octulosonic-acid transferase